MPHFIIDCSENIFELQEPGILMKQVHDTAESTGLFAPGDIKVRINPYQFYLLADGKKYFLHVFGYIMQGRSVDERHDLAERITKALYNLLPDIPILSVNIAEFEKNSYCNRALIHPLNIERDRHFPVPSKDTFFP